MSNYCLLYSVIYSAPVTHRDAYDIFCLQLIHSDDHYRYLAMAILLPTMRHFVVYNHVHADGAHVATKYKYSKTPNSAGALRLLKLTVDIDTFSLGRLELICVNHNL